MPNTTFADCIITDYSDKFSVVCSGYNPAAPPTTKHKKIKAAHRLSKPEKVSFTDREGIMTIVGMNEEELQYMQAKNKMEGSRIKIKPKVQTARN